MGTRASRAVVCAAALLQVPSAHPTRRRRRRPCANLPLGTSPLACDMGRTSRERHTRARSKQNSQYKFGPRGLGVAYSRSHKPQRSCSNKLKLISSPRPRLGAWRARRRASHARAHGSRSRRSLLTPAQSHAVARESRREERGSVAGGRCIVCREHGGGCGVCAHCRGRAAQRWR